MSSNLSVEEQMRRIRQGTSEILPEGELEDKLARAAAEGEPLRIKEGFDASAPDLHLGHTVTLRKLRTFQDLGHMVIFLIGDFTGMIGDPTGKSQTRPMLSREEVEANAETYKRQVFRILDPDRTEIRFNSEWCGPMDSADVLRLASRYTVARMIERDDFSRRYQAGTPISLQEFLYPLFQGYDSVALEADVEVGGSDQKFNLLVGRDLQAQYGQRPQTILTMPLLPGTDGVEKMSKSLGNAIGIEEPPSEIFGKVMSIPDRIMPLWYELLSSLDPDGLVEILARLEDPAENPGRLKRRLAADIITQYHGEEAARAAEAEFDRIFVEKGAPSEVEERRLPVRPEPYWIVALLHDLGLVASRGEARRLIQQGGVSVDGQKVDDPALELPATAGRRYRLKVGKRSFLDLVVDG
jgi:tyrosyl-tRNA synthetase